jgi:hypothetical protein
MFVDTYTNVYRMNVCRGAGVWSRADIVINITKGSFFVSPEEESWKCSICGEELESRKGAVYHEKYVCEGLKDKRSVLSKDEKLIGEEVARRKEEAERRKEEEVARRKEEAAAREKSEQQIAEEGDELDSFTYKSRESSKRFPTNTTLIGVYRMLGYIVIVICILIGVIVGGEQGSFLGLIVVVVGVAIGINFMLVSEMIRFLMDFHDTNYINTKVRIKTLEALQEISKKLKK